ncbi:helix-turn-helix transcriptional regulator [Nocardia sp. NPDC004168]|uniref:helix-turn-helix domain-containing protein n=1 Tax=Nocardia sp. NPDC004168 TaxID=3154452 RepID=UPI0033A2BCB9
MTGAAQSKQVLGTRLRELRKSARLSGRELGNAAGWHWSKVSRIETGKQSPSEADLEDWCRICGAELVLPDLIASLRNARAQWAEWKRVAAGGHAHRQRRGVKLDTDAHAVRIYSSVIVSGLLQTESYARAVLSTCIGFLGTYDDLEEAVNARMTRGSALRTGRTKFSVLLHEPVLYTCVGDEEVRKAQLQHLLDTGFGNPRLVLGIVPMRFQFVYTTTSFALYDARLALVETLSAELSITTPSELLYYEKAWEGLRRQAAYGDEARAMIIQAGRATEP